MHFSLIQFFVLYKTDKKSNFKQHVLGIVRKEGRTPTSAGLKKSLEVFKFGENFRQLRKAERENKVLITLTDGGWVFFNYLK